MPGMSIKTGGGFVAEILRIHGDGRTIRLLLLVTIRPSRCNLVQQIDHLGGVLFGDSPHFRRTGFDRPVLVLPELSGRDGGRQWLRDGELSRNWR